MTMSTTNDTSAKKILVVVTSNDRFGDTGRKTGYYLPEVSHPLARFKKAGFHVDFLSPKGGVAPMDPSSADRKDPDNAALLDDAAAMGKLKATLRPDEVRPEAYDAIFFAGGMGTMWDFAQDERLGALASDLYDRGKIVAAVCHGPAALLSARTKDGKALVQGKRVAAFSNAEETAAGHDGIIPYHLESALVDKGALYEAAPLWKSKVVVSERLVTGQNPASASGVADAVVEAMQDAGVKAP
jgi:putative intracellular protease/amidase